ncbi:class E sortase [Streptomyces sp. SID8361]|uniref:class E sortase n=1 Tax=Streptomyces TaxID=1883 RepID=UPI000B8402AB|nr:MULTISPECIES: class E sortase [unclassified Streptomyces]MCD9595046.1 class E sortase [Streptomyces sp. 8ZJF_21]MCM3809972.1 class E sortase [Streptomyces sp. DR7-3]MYU11682.1 class E sortase [Streptomyces sp. SID8361]WHX20688.1 class E sortase [Streptomyces sp. NA07423]
MRRRGGRAVLARGLWTAGELAVTLGVVVLLFVVHQLWWTNRQARADARHEVSALERRWDDRAAEGAEAATPAPGAPRSGTAGSSGGDERDRATGGGGQGPRRDQAYAVLRIPRIGLTVPIAEGIGRAAVLNKGYVGHYPRTAQPGQAGNVALAGHRNTHGEPFRQLDEVRPGDTVRIETADARYTYAVERTLPRTSPADGTVIARVPFSSTHPRYRYTEPGYYLTLTTCTPEFTSRYRLVVWARLKAAEPRSVGGAD